MAGESWLVTMPKLGETVSEGTVGAWLKNVGDTVAFDDPLFEVSSDKVDSEFPSPYDGVILEILVGEGETVPVGTELVRIGEPGAKVSDSGAAAAAPAAVAPAAAVGPSAAPLAAGGSSGKLYSPIVRRLAAENNVDLAGVTGTGAGGRINRQDIEAAIASGPATAAAPSVPSAKPAAAPAAAAAAGGDPRDEVVKLSRMRLAVGAGMIHSLQSAAQVWTSVEVDYENVEQMRRKHKEAFKAQTGASLSYLPFAARAVCEVLLKIPPVNASIDFENKTQTLHPYVNLGIAVDMDEQGLIVPVIKNADQLNLRGLAQQIKQKAEDGRNKVLPAEDMKGSTFTITNPGRTFASGPVINQPNVAIVATEGVSRKPVAVGDAIAIHHVGVISLVYDHRAFDGVVATRFLLAIKDIIENRDWETELG
jgi:2-oxoglutarate dehydrogenase E2 component (dihydrolipoamide succinyltransferase)